MDLTSSDLKKIEVETSQLLKYAGKHILNHWHDLHKLTYKNKRDIASEVDVEVENTLKKKLKKILPNAGFIVEEGITTKVKGYNWVIDPIDGTKYYVNDAPLFLTQIALVKNDIPVLGQVYNPVSDQFFSASKGNDAFLNGTAIRAKMRSNLDEAIIDVDFGGNDQELEWKLKVLSLLTSKAYRIRMTGNFLFMYLVTGAIDASIILYKYAKLVDFLPGVIIMREAGFIVDFIEIEKRKVLIASNKKLIKKIRNIIS